jgi:uncharacterized phage-associated protein
MDSVIVEKTAQPPSSSEVRVTYTADDIANWFMATLDRSAGDAVTHLKLQKLVYYAQAWSLALLGRPLFEEDIQAWTHGPVVPSLFQRFRDFGWHALPPPDSVPDLEPEVEELLGDITLTYGEHSALKLEELTHGEAPWLLARGGIAIELRCTNVIPKAHMRDFYRSLYDKLGDEEEPIPSCDTQQDCAGGA